MSAMKQIYIAMHEDGRENSNAIARISLKAFQLYQDFEDGKISGFGERLSSLCKELTDANSNWDEVREWLENWKESIESNHSYLIIDNLDNCIQTATNLGFDDEADLLHDGLVQIELNIDEMMATA